MRKLDALFVIPGGKKKIFQQLADDFSAIEPPVMVGLIANYLRNRNISVDIIDAPALGIDNNEIINRISSINPHLVVVVACGHQPSASTQTMPAARKIARRIKNETGILVMIMGTHPSALPKRTLEEEAVDFVCQGEGPITIYETVQAIKKAGDFSKIRGLWHWKDGKPICSAYNPVITNITDEFSEGVSWDILPMEKYRAHNWHCFDNIDARKPYAALYTSFGCPFSCNFCCINAPFGKPSYRMFSPEWVIKEIDILVNKYGVRNIKIIDEMFVLNQKHVLGICDKIIERGYDLNIWAYARIDTVKDEFLDKLRRAGFCWLALGIESGSRHVRDSAEKGKFDETKILEVVRKIQNAGMYVGANYIFGLPDDTLETMRDTLNLAMEINAEWANFYCAMAYPGSKLYSLAKSKEWKLPDNPDGPGWIGYSQHSYECLPLPTDFVSAVDVLRFRDNAFSAYFKNPSYLSMIKRKFGEKALKHIEEMMSISLKRKLLDE